MSETEFSVGKNCGVTFAGIKPSSLVSVKKEGANERGKGFSFVFRLFVQDGGRGCKRACRKNEQKRLSA